MANYFILELDTTPPVLTITTPTYRVYAGEAFELDIVSNEILADRQDITIRDLQNNIIRRCYLNKISDTHLNGLIYLNDLVSQGILILKVRLFDSVDNPIEYTKQWFCVNRVLTNNIFGVEIENVNNLK